MKKPFLLFFVILIGTCVSLSGCEDNPEKVNPPDNPLEENYLMFITDKAIIENRLKSDSHWINASGIERTPGGRLYSTYITGGTTEEIGNYSVLLMSDDDGDIWQPLAIAYMRNNARCFEPVVWIDPMGRLWFTFVVTAEGTMWTSTVYASICEFPDQPSPVFSQPRIIAPGLMRNKPTVTSDGRWLFPINVMSYFNMTVPGFEGGRSDYAYVYESIDQGETFEIIGYADAANRNFDEHMILEKNDNTLNMYIRTTYGIALSQSFNGGRTWSFGVNSGIPSPSSRFHIRRLRSGRVLMINHYNFVGRNNMTAMLSDDDGLTWSHTLLLDERSGVSYPDAVETEDGFIYVIYDYLRYGPDRAILMAKITEGDILAGSLVNNGSYLKKVIHKAP